MKMASEAQVGTGLVRLRLARHRLPISAVYSSDFEEEESEPFEPPLPQGVPPAGLAAGFLSLGLESSLPERRNEPPEFEDSSRGL